MTYLEKFKNKKKIWLKLKTKHFHDCRQFVNLLTDIHETDFLERFLLAVSFFDELLAFICAATSAACLANSSIKIQ